MKKIKCLFLTTTLAMVGLFQNALSQNTSPYWSLAGNSNATTSSKLGTTNNVSLRFYTANKQRMIIGYSTGNVGIGNASPASRLHVTGTSKYTTALRVDNGRITVDVPWDSGDTSIGIYSTGGTGVFGVGEIGLEGHGLVGVNGQGLRGVVGKSLYGAGSGVEGYGDDYGDGVYGESTNGYGVHGFSYKENGVYGESGLSNGTGVYGKSYNGVYGITDIAGGQGVYGTASGSNAWGVRGYSANSIGVYGSTGNTASYAGYFSGNVYATGTFTSSDGNLKKDIADVTGAMAVLKRLQPKSYNFKQDGDFKEMNLPAGTHYGLIAQEVEQVLPELVKATTFEAARPTPAPAQKRGEKPAAVAVAASKTISFKALNYTELIPIVIKGMQEQDNRLQEQDLLIEKLMQRIDALERKTSAGTNAVTTTLSQATPNPAKGTTRITYSIPADSRAQLLLTDAAGKTLKAITLTNSGFVALNTAGLSSGTYNYTLVVNGKAADTKKLIIAR